MKLSPVSRAAGGGRMEMVRTSPAGAVGRTDLMRGVVSVERPVREVVQSGVASRQSSASIGSSSPSGAVPSAAFA